MISFYRYYVYNIRTNHQISLNYYTISNLPIIYHFTQILFIKKNIKN